MFTFVIPAAVVEVAPDVFEAHAERIRSALRLSDITPEKASVWMALDAAQLHRNLAGDGHLSMKRLAALPVDFWAWYGLLICMDYGLPKRVAEADMVRRALKRPAVKMALKTQRDVAC